MPELVLTRGLPASGKSTFAREWVAEDPEWRVRINRDDIRFMLQDKAVLDHMGEDNVTLLQRAGAEAALRAGRSVIIDDTNLRAAFVKDWLKFAQRLGVEVEFVDFEVDIDELIRRDNKRLILHERSVGDSVIRNLAARFTRKGKLPAVPTLDEAFSKFRVYEPDTTLQHAYLFDIDGTLADMAVNGRNPYDYTRVSEDGPIENVIRVLHALKDNGYTLIFMSGREDSCMNATREWLAKYVMESTPFELYMRRTGDGRSDDIVKHELFYKHVADDFHVVGVFDDRQKVVDMWRQIGLTCFQVAPGDF